MHERFAADANAKNSDATRFGPREAVMLSLDTRRRLTIANKGERRNRGLKVREEEKRSC